jgi:DNA-binding transcriptional LysR family regulator
MLNRWCAALIAGRHTAFIHSDSEVRGLNEQDWVLLDCLSTEHNLSVAAEKLFLSQPTLTYRLQQIETEFGVKIFTRIGKRNKLTPEGEHLVAYAQSMLLELRKTKDYLSDLHHDHRSKLRLGVSGNYAWYKLGPDLHEFHRQYPNIQIHVITGLSSEMYRLLQTQDVHLCIIRGDYDWYEHKRLLGSEHVCLISREPVELEELPTLPRIEYSSASRLAGSPKYKTDPVLNKTIDGWWSEWFDTPPFIAMQVDHIELAKQLVRLGAGYAIVPEICITDADRSTLHTQRLTLRSGQPFARKTWLLCRNSSLELSPMQKFVAHVKPLDA